jgi:cell division protein FtsA
MSKKYFVTGLDIGTNNIKMLSAQKTDDQKFEIVSQVQVPSVGVRKGIVINVEETAKSIEQAVLEMQELSNHKIKDVFCGVGGSHIFIISGQGRVAVSRADETVSQEDIDRAVLAAGAVSLPPNKEIIHTLPKEFVLDGEGGIKDVLGMKGIRLEAHTLLLGGFTPYIKNLTQTVLASDLGINDLILSPMASSRAILTPKQKELGVALVDIGGATTSLAVFEEGSLIHLNVLPIGSSHITNDIAIGLKIDINLAEKIKLEYGTAIYQSSGKREMINISEEVEEPISFSKKELAEIIESRLSEIFDLITKDLKSISKNQLLPAGIVLTGGGSKLPKIKDFVKRELKLPVQIGQMSEFTEPLEDPAFSVCAGLVLLSQEDYGTEEQSFSSGSGFGSKVKKIFEKFVP